MRSPEACTRAWLLEGELALPLAAAPAPAWGLAEGERGMAAGWSVASGPGWRRGLAGGEAARESFSWLQRGGVIGYG